MSYILCPLNHRNEPGTRFCVECNTPIPPGTIVVQDLPDIEPVPPVAPSEPPPEEELPPREEIRRPVDEGPPRDRRPTGDVDARQPPPPPQTTEEDGIKCPNCGEWNPADQERWCWNCFALLREEPEEIVEEPEPLPWLWIAAGAGLGLIIGLFFLIRAIIGDGDVTDTTIAGDTTVVTTATTLPPTTTLPPLEQLASSAVGASASSEQPDGDNVAANMLDGRPDTAWGHCGFNCQETNGIGESVTFTFDQAYVIVSFTIINGYDKTVDNGDRWEENNRIQTMTVTGDGDQSTTVALNDVRTVQTVALDFSEPTSQIVFTVDSVFEGNRFNDVSISEVTFTHQPGAG